MLPTKYLCTAAVLTLTALSFGQDKIKIEPKWDKDLKMKVSMKGEIEVGGMTAKLDSKLSWSAKPGDDGSTVTLHHDELSIVVMDQEVPVPFNDFIATYNKAGVLTKLDGGIEGADPLRWFLTTTFYAPTKEVAKDVVTKWEVEGNEKLGIGARSIETTYLGEATIGKNKAFKFKQVTKEAKTDFGTEGTLWVTANGQVVKAEVTFKGLPIPQAGGDATGKFAVTVLD